MSKRKVYRLASEAGKEVDPIMEEFGGHIVNAHMSISDGEIVFNTLLNCHIECGKLLICDCKVIDTTITASDVITIDYVNCPDNFSTFPFPHFGSNDNLPFPRVELDENGNIAPGTYKNTLIKGGLVPGVYTFINCPIRLVSGKGAIEIKFVGEANYEQQTD